MDNKLIKIFIINKLMGFKSSFKIILNRTIQVHNTHDMYQKGNLPRH